MSDNFHTAMITVLRHEGGKSDDKADKGGATNYGISTRFLKQIDKDIDGDGHVTSKDVDSITLEKANELYKTYFWDHYKLDRIRDVHIATKAMDIFVNMRSRVAAKILQKACNTLITDGKEKLVEDGILGSKSFLTLNRLSMFTDGKAKLMSEIRKEQAAVYHKIVKADKSQGKFLKGWLARAAS